MKVRYFSEYFTYFFKVLPINERGLRKISVHANVADERNLLLFVYCVEELIVPVLINQNLHESCIFLNENHARLSLKKNYNIRTSISAFY